MTGPLGRRVLRFDSHFVAEGCGGGWRRKIKRGAPDGAGCVERLCSLRSRGLSGLRLLRVVVSPSAMNMKSALRAIGHACGVRVLKIDGAFAPRVLSLTAAAPLRVMVVPYRAQV